jgi:hypothetical protein
MPGCGSTHGSATGLALSLVCDYVLMLILVIFVPLEWLFSRVNSSLLLLMFTGQFFGSCEQSFFRRYRGV